MHEGMHRLFLTQCEMRMKHVSAVECEKCGQGNVIDNRSRVICGGVTRFFATPCCVEMQAAATVDECEKCKWGEVGQDRIRVYCARV